MKLFYDPGRNVAYFAFHDTPARVHVMQLSQNVRIDISEDGMLYGIELRNAERFFRQGDRHVLEIINESLDEQKDVELGWETNVAAE